MKTIAIIPARGGSKRIPRKNIKPFLGKPIIFYPIRACLEVFDKVIVSTEDPEIKEVSLSFGAEVYDRPQNLADDLTTAGEVVAECLEHNRGYSIGACVFPTAVFVTPEVLRSAIDGLGLAHETFPVVRYSHPIQRALEILPEGYVRQLNAKFASVRTQDCPPTYHDAGQFYIFKVRPFMYERSLFMRKAKPIIIDDLKTQDIDNESDWKMAEIKYQL